jgi:hypothetical protein
MWWIEENSQLAVRRKPLNILLINYQSGHKQNHNILLLPRFSYTQEAAQKLITANAIALVMTKILPF